jgi:hypothetical protein
VPIPILIELWHCHNGSLPVYAPKPKRFGLRYFGTTLKKLLQKNASTLITLKVIYYYAESNKDKEISSNFFKFDEEKATNSCADGANSCARTVYWRLQTNVCWKVVLAPYLAVLISKVIT